MARTFSGLVRAALKDMEHRGFPDTTTSTYGIAANQFLAFLTTEYRDDVRYFTAPIVQRFVDKLAEHRAPPSTVCQKLAALRAVGRFGLRWPSLESPTLTADPTLPIPRPRHRRRHQTMPLPAELRAILAVPLTARGRLVRDLILDTGLRASEVCRAKVGDLQEHPDGWYLVCRVKGGDEPLTPLSPEVAEQIRDDLLGRNMPGPEAPLLVRDDGRTAWRKSTLNWFIRQLGKRAGVTRFRLGPHKLRHLVANLGKGEIDALTRSRMLHHTSPTTIQHYDHAGPGELRAARQTQRRALMRYLGGPEAQAPAVDPGALARALEALARIPADQLPSVVEALERLAGRVHSATESEAPRLNATGENVNPGAGEEGLLS